MEELHEARKDDRTEFQRDYDRLIFSAPFRRFHHNSPSFYLLFIKPLLELSISL